MNFDSIKIIISEVDGIITDGLVGFGELNSVLFKQFFIKDFEAINLIKKNYGFVFISSEAAVNMSMCKKRQIPFYMAERSKTEVYGNILRKFDISPENVLYVGSSYSDIDCLRMSNTSMCPEDAPSKVKNVVDHVIPVYSGNGVICYLCDMLYKIKHEVV